MINGKEINEYETVHVQTQFVNKTKREYNKRRDANEQLLQGIDRTLRQ